MALNVFVFFADSYISEIFLLIFSESIFVDMQVILPLLLALPDCIFKKYTAFTA